MAETIVHVYNTEGKNFKNSVEMVQYAIDTQTPLVAYCGHVWLPESTDYITGDACEKCLNGHPQAYEGGGIWFVYGVDTNTCPIAVFADGLEARRWKDQNAPYSQIRFWMFGTEWNNK